MKKLSYILLAVCILTACDKKIDEVRPLTKIDQEGELASLSGILETTVGNYMLLGAIAYPVTDFGESHGNNVTLQTFAPAAKKTDSYYFRNSTGPTAGYNADFFRSSYQLIVSVNTTLEGMAVFEKSAYSGLTDDDKARFLYAKGENMFLRALVYFQLTRVYGKPYYQTPESSPAVPLKKTSALSDMPAPATVKEMYDFITSELQTAAQLMKAPVTKVNAFASTGAAWSLLSRAYLYMGGTVATPDAANNQLAVKYADSVINLTAKYALQQGSAYSNMFGDDENGSLGRAKAAGTNKEIIFMKDNQSGGSGVGEIYHFDRSYNVGAVFLPSSSLRALFSANDLRGKMFKLNANSGREETTKYLVTPQAWITYAPQIFFRLGEIYLNRAEAYAKLNNFALAKADLKAIHTRAGLPAADIDGLANTAVLDAVLLERRMELAFEGHNSYDYYRNGLPMVRTAADNNGTAQTIQPDDPKVVFAIPNN